MTDPTPPAEPGEDEDEIAELLLADAASALDEPDTGDPTTSPDMGVLLTQPAPPAPSGPANPPAPPAPPTPNPSPPPPAPPAPSVVPQFVAPIPTPPGQSGTGTPGQPTLATGTNPPSPAAGTNPEVFDYPENTPLAQMTAEQRAEYWRHKARKHEDRVKSMNDYDQYKAAYDEYQRLLAASQTEQERAVAEAHRQGRAAALAEAGGQLVEQWVRAAAAGRISEEGVNALLQGLDRSRFLNQNGGVDTDRVYAFVGTLAPAASAPAAGTPGQQPPPPGQPAQVPPPPVVAPPRGPDFGQGQPGTSKPSGLAAGREIARRRFGEPSTTAPAR